MPCPKSGCACERVKGTQLPVSPSPSVRALNEGRSLLSSRFRNHCREGRKNRSHDQVLSPRESLSAFLLPAKNGHAMACREHERDVAADERLELTAKAEKLLEPEENKESVDYFPSSKSMSAHTLTVRPGSPGSRELICRHLPSEQ